MTDPQTSTFGTGTTDPAITTIRRGLEAAPVLRDGLGLTFALAAVGSAGRIVVPILIQQAIDKGIAGRDEVRVGLVVQLALIAVVAVCVAALALRTAQVRLGERSEQALYDLRSKLINHINHLSLADHNEERRGGLVARVTSDIETLTQFFQWGGMAWMRSSTLMVIVGIAMLAYDWLLALIAFAISFPLALVLRAVQKRLVVAHGQARKSNGIMLGAIAEVVSGAPAIRAYGAGSMLAEVVEETTERKARDQIRAALYGAFLFPSGEIFAVFTVSAVIGVGVWRGPAEGLTAGALVSFVFLTYRFLEPIAEFTEIIDQTQTAVAGLHRVLSVLDMPITPTEPDEPTPLPLGRLDIAIEHVDYLYPIRNGEHIDSAAGGGVLVLRDISLLIPAGQQVAMVGSTGSGKTTLGRLIARFADPTNGTVAVGGVPLTDVARSDLRSRLVVVSQEPFLFDDTVERNIAFARSGANRADVEAIVRDLDVGEWVDALSEGLDTRVGERGGQLSAGERQLVALLRAGLADPDVLILDEATSSVDALTEVRIARALDVLASTRTTIAIAHRLSTAARADRVLVLADGVLVEDGHHDDLVQQGGTYAGLFDAWVSATSVGDAESVQSST
ncbi:ABC transporter ATP-binding protein [Ilumatobacter sp.]|uniref:ABC transporter ATP-binding protein n=1 Tax=Ilumatobacter sp. TaxID=1967498 RepID=UPI003F6A9CD0